MGMVMVKCPQTGHAIPTGIQTDRESFGRSAVFFLAHPLPDLPRRSRLVRAGSLGRRAEHPGPAPRRPGVSIDTDQAVIAMGGQPWRECKYRPKRPPGCCRPRTFFTKHEG